MKEKTLLVAALGVLLFFSLIQAFEINALSGDMTRVVQQNGLASSTQGSSAADDMASHHSGGTGVGSSGSGDSGSSGMVGGC